MSCLVLNEWVRRAGEVPPWTEGGGAAETPGVRSGQAPRESGDGAGTIQKGTQKLEVKPESGCPITGRGLALFPFSQPEK